MSFPYAHKIRQVGPAVLAIAALALTAASSAMAANYHDAIRDCFDDGQLEGHYSRHVLQQALHHLPSDEAEYSDCSDVLRRALLASASRGGGGGGGGSLPTPPSNPSLTTPSGAQAGSQQAYNNLKKQTSNPGSAAAPKVAIGGRLVKPGVGGVLAASHTGPNELPNSLLASLIARAAICSLAAILVIRRRWPETRRVALRLLRR
jgi:hypothetical protein